LKPFPIFIGYDPREAVAYHVACQSILEKSSVPVAFIPLQGERRDGSNDFIYARFLVPELCGFQGAALFIDSDVIVRCDIAELLSLHRLDQGAQVVKHDYKTKHPVKYLGNRNEDYPRKNWSSVILWNCGYYPNRILTREFVAKSSGSFLHRFEWLRDDQIGALPSGWNRLVLEQELTDGDKLRHFTIGTPCFDDYAYSDEGGEWHATLKRAMAPCTL